MPPAQPPPRVANPNMNAHPETEEVGSSPNGASPPTHIIVEQVNGDHQPTEVSGVARTPTSPSDITTDSEGGEEELNAPLMQVHPAEGSPVAEGTTVVTHSEQVRTASLVYHQETTEAWSPTLLLMKSYPLFPFYVLDSKCERQSDMFKFL